MGSRSELGGILLHIFQVYPQGVSLVSSSTVENLGGSETFWYLAMSFGAR